jgi:hypothetical protein
LPQSLRKRRRRGRQRAELRRHCNDCVRKRFARASPARPQRADFRAFRDAAAAHGLRRRGKFARVRRQKPRVCAGFGGATACRRREMAQQRRDGRARRQRRERRGKGDRARHGGMLRRGVCPIVRRRRPD